MPRSFHCRGIALGCPGLHPEFLADLVLNFLIAGRDTTAQALSWCLFQVMQHPEVEERILEERRSLGRSYHGLRTSARMNHPRVYHPFKRAGTWWMFNGMINQDGTPIFNQQGRIGKSSHESEVVNDRTVVGLPIYRCRHGLSYHKRGWSFAHFHRDVYPTQGIPNHAGMTIHHIQYHVLTVASILWVKSSKNRGQIGSSWFICIHIEKTS